MHAFTIDQVMTDLDAPSPSEPNMREWVHWYNKFLPFSFLQFIQTCRNGFTVIINPTLLLSSIYTDNTLKKQYTAKN